MPAKHSETSQLKALRSKILEVAHAGGEGHIPSAFSILEILWVIYEKVLPRFGGRFVLSKGHASLALYVVLAEKGVIPPSWLETFAKYDSALGGHPDSTQVPGVEASTGSLGHGFPFAAGLAYASRLDGSEDLVFAIIGDGEANEGTIWETALVAKNLELDNLVCIVDANDSSTRAIDIEPLSDKFQSFGWSTETVDGHDIVALEKVLTPGTSGGCPRAVIARTIKGKGLKEMESNPAWHHTKLLEADLVRFLEELS